MKKFIYYSLLACALLACSCHDEPVGIPLPPEMKEWVYFKPGSYWIYQNDSTGEIDSVFVVSASFKTDSDYADGELKRLIDNVNVEMRNSGNDRIYIEASIYCNVFEDYEIGGLKKEFRFIYTGNNNKVIKDDTIAPISATLNTIVKSYNNYFLKEIEFTDVLHYKVNVRNVEGTNGSYINFHTYNEYYLAKNKWIIKKIEGDRNGFHYWSVIRYKIVQ
jgi:hypothetical protein